MARFLKNVEMREKHCRTWNRAKTLKTVEKEKCTL
jgi:hypothetical protein